MSETFGLSSTQLRTEERNEVAAFCKSLCDATLFSVQSITLYGSSARQDYRPGRSDINILIVLDRIDVPILRSVLEVVLRGRRYGISPFFITEENLRSSTDVFPVKFLAMRESRQVLVGRDILYELEISQEHLRLRCEQEIKNLLLRLRRHYIMGAGQGLAEVLARMIVGFLETLRFVISLSQGHLPPREDVVDISAEAFGLDSKVLRRTEALRKHGDSLSRDEAEKLYDEFMAIVGRVAQVVDSLS